MVPLEIKKYPAKILRKQCEAVKTVTDEERTIFDGMLFTMRHYCGIGLAAPQVGISKRMIVASVGEVTIKLANPEIVGTKGSDRMPEGCLSVVNTVIDIPRPVVIEVRGLNEKGKTIELKTSGLLARVLQHEIDHLDGKLIIDCVSALQRSKEGNVEKPGKKNAGFPHTPVVTWDDKKWTPEELFVASVEGFLKDTFVDCARKDNFAFLSFESKSEWTVEKVEGKLTFSEIKLRPRIVVRSTGQIAKAKELIELAEQKSPVAHFVTSKITVYPEIKVG